MNKLKVTLACIFGLLQLVSGVVNADIKLNDFWVVAAPSVATSTAIYGEIKNEGDEADTLISVRTEHNDVMVHKTEIRNGMAKMLHKKNLKIAAQSSLLFKPMSYHLMVKNTDLQGKENSRFLVLFFKFKHAGIIKTSAPIRNPW